MYLNQQSVTAKVQGVWSSAQKVNAHNTPSSQVTGHSVDQDLNLARGQIGQNMEPHVEHGHDLR